MCKHVATLKPERGNGIVLFDNKDYTDSAEHLFKDPEKFQFIYNDPTITWIK